MRVLLVTWTDQLQQKLIILNPELEYCAIVVDEVEPAKEILKRVGLPASLLHPLYDLKECVRDFYYDYVLCVEDGWIRDFDNQIQKYGVQKNKIVVLDILAHNNFFIERSLRYFKEHVAEFDMFATGMSYTELGLDVNRFRFKLFNFGDTSQDLYYNFQVAKRAIVYGGGHDGKLRYALIGIAPYGFYWDQSKAHNRQSLLLWYFIAFKDLHNFHLSNEVYEQFFRKEYLATKMPLEPFDVNNTYFGKTVLRTYFKENALQLLTQKQRLNFRDDIDPWEEKNYPDTRAENIKILDDYLTLCGQNRIRPIIFLPPMSTLYKKYFNKQKIDEFYYLVGQACKKHPYAIFIDGWKLQGLTDADFRDISHMNVYGAAKFSTFLNSVIEQLDRQ